MTTIKAKSRLVYRDLIRESIYSQIVNGDLQPGEHIREMEWAKAFNTSQAPVREAIRDLESRGVVESIPFKGSFVRELTVKDLRDIHQVRAGLEGVALKNAIIKATDKDIEKLHQCLIRMKQYARSGEQKKFREEDVAFHKTIVQLADTTELMKMWNMCNVELWTAFNIISSATELIEFADSHDAIYEVLKNRDLTQAYSIMEAHFEEVLDNLVEDEA